MKFEKGMTLLEILIALLIGGIVMTAIYQTTQSLQQSYLLQQGIANMQQNLRVAMFMMVSEIRMAGYDPSGKADAGIVSAVPASMPSPADDAMVRFTRDLNGDGDTEDSAEDITYSLYRSNGIQKLGRRNPTLNRPVIKHVDALDFVFLDEQNHETDVEEEIRSIQISIVVRIEREDKNYLDRTEYRNQKNRVIFGPAGDGYRRSMLTSQIRCRNLGLP